eukprot:4624103-Pyramimonas_sp.AAC.1
MVEEVELGGNGEHVEEEKAREHEQARRPVEVEPPATNSSLRGSAKMRWRSKRWMRRVRLPPPLLPPRRPALCFWAHLSQSPWECRLSLARKPKVAIDRAAAIVMPLAFK